jgi:hypothetical protein
MKRQNIGLVLLAIAVGVLGLYSVQAQRKAGRKVALPVETQGIATANYAMSGPYTHNNLSIFLIHGQDSSKGKIPLTLKEAMEQKKVIVHETGEVNRLAIQNISQEEIFVQSGEIVKGGQQDRVLAIDLIVPPKSGKMPIDSFCVEQGRWSRRGEEAVSFFSSSDKTLNSKDLKIAAKHKASQGDVWDKVARSQIKLSEGVMASMRAPDSVPAGGGIRAAGGGGANAGTSAIGSGPAYSVASPSSSSSLQLSLENEDLQETVKNYIEKLSPIINGKNDVIGYAFAINGQINSADIYSSHGLFQKLWPKLLESSAIEAVGEFEKGKTFESVTADAMSAFLNEAEAGKAASEAVTPRVMLIKRETEKNLFFETRDSKKDGGWIHRNYITK